MSRSQANLDRWERYTDWPLALAALVFLILFSVQVLAPGSPARAHAFWLIDWAIWGLFIVDYVVRVALAPSRFRWFVNHLLDFMIVALPLMRPLRLLRLLYLISVVQRAVGDALRGRLLVYTISAVLMLIYTASLAIFETERDLPGATITTFGKALWWSIATVTTVGYGDVYPITDTGRVIAVLLMIGGISLVGVVTASIASWIIQSVAQEETAGQAATVEHIDQLRAEIRALRGQLERGDHYDRHA